MLFGIILFEMISVMLSLKVIVFNLMLRKPQDFNKKTLHSGMLLGLSLTLFQIEVHIKATGKVFNPGWKMTHRLLMKN